MDGQQHEQSSLVGKQRSGYGSVSTPLVKVSSKSLDETPTLVRHSTLPLGLDSGNGKHGNGLFERQTSLDRNGVHCHRDRGETIDYHARRKLITASLLCLAFMSAEIVGGWLSKSLAIATDAAHLLTDFTSFMISLFSLWVSARPATRRMSFGWYRAEVLGALTSVLLIWVVTAVLVYLAVIRIIQEDYDIDATIMLITSGVGVGVNLIMGVTLHQHGHSHAVEPSSVTRSTEEETLLDTASVEGGESVVSMKSQASNINVRAAFIHVLGDLIQSVGVFTAAIVIYYKPEWSIVDPICTFLFSILVLMTTFAIIRDTLQVLMEATPKGLKYCDVLTTLQNANGVLRVHNLRIWALSLDKIALSAHLVIYPGSVPEKVLRGAENTVRNRYNIFEMTLQVEDFEQSMESCEQCVLPEN